MKLPHSTESKIDRNKRSGNVSKCELADAALVLCNLTENNYQQDLRVLQFLISLNGLVANWNLHHLHSFIE